MAVGGERVFLPWQQAVKGVNAPPLAEEQPSCGGHQLRSTEEAGALLNPALRARRVGKPCEEGPVTTRGWSEASSKLSTSSWLKGIKCLEGTPPRLAKQTPQLGCPTFPRLGPAVGAL